MKFWDTFKFKNYQENILAYCRSDTLLLSTVFMKYRNSIFRDFSIDPALYLGTPSLAFDLFLKGDQKPDDRIKLDYIYDPEMYDFFRKGIRGGVSFVSTRHATGCADIFQSNEKFLTYLDINSLYPTNMIRKLPEKNYSWLSQQECNDFCK